jgi:opacity protein-like surface antigen
LPPEEPLGEDRAAGGPGNPYTMKILFTVVAACAAVSMLAGQSEPVSEKAQWHFPVHLGYVSGISKVTDAMLEGGGSADTLDWPIGASFQPFVMFPSGLGFGFDVGPLAIFGVELDGDDEWDDSETSVILPLGAYVRYDFAPADRASPYVRAGLRQCLVGGDFLRNGSIGANVGIGLEFNRDRRVSFGLEASYDSCEVEVLQIWTGTYVDEKPYGFMASVFVNF